jgi:hypothetical protein
VSDAESQHRAWCGVLADDRIVAVELSGIGRVKRTEVFAQVESLVLNPSRQR